MVSGTRLVPENYDLGRGNASVDDLPYALAIAVRWEYADQRGLDLHHQCSACVYALSFTSGKPPKPFSVFP